MPKPMATVRTINIKVNEERGPFFTTPEIAARDEVCYYCNYSINGGCVHYWFEQHKKLADLVAHIGNRINEV